jgi:hypothetical protein
LQLDNYNPTSIPSNPSFLGTELISNNAYKLRTGLNLEVRGKYDTPIRGGVVVGIFLYREGFYHDEVDVEVLSSQSRVLTNVYANEPLGKGSPVFSSIPVGTDTKDHTYKVTIYQNQILWYIDGKLVRTEKNKVPAGPFNVHLNMWAPDSDFSDAYSGRIQPTTDPDDNRRFTFSVDYVKLQRVRPRKPSTPVTPSIQITQVPPIGVDGNLYGRVTGVNLANYQGLATFIKVGGWWMKPYEDDPITEIQSNGFWNVDFITGGNDINATEMRVYLIPNGFQVPVVLNAASLPSSLSGLISASVKR